MLKIKIKIIIIIIIYNKMICIGLIWRNKLKKNLILINIQTLIMKNLFLERDHQLLQEIIFNHNPHNNNSSSSSSSSSSNNNNNKIIIQTKLL